MPFGEPQVVSHLQGKHGLWPEKPQVLKPSVGARALERTVSQRLIQPFSRWIVTDPRCMALLGEWGLGCADLVDPEMRLPIAACTALLETCLVHQNDPAIGLKAALMSRAGDFGLVEQAARHGSTLREAIECAASHLSLLHGGATLTIEARGDRSLLTVNPYRVRTALPAVDDFAVGSLFRFVTENLGDTEGWQAWFTHPMPRYSSEYARTFTIPVCFSAPLSGLALPSDQLGRPLRQANADLARAFAAQAAARVRQSEHHGGLAGTVEQLVSHKLADDGINMRCVARSMGMSIPTLRRRLREQGTGFREIVSKVRLERARRLLAEGHRLEEVAAFVGYADPGALSRALARHTGMTAAAYRQCVLARPPSPLAFGPVNTV